MYKISTAKEKLKSKIREHFYKLMNDIKRLKDLPEFANKKLKPILLLNIIDRELIKEMARELHKDLQSKEININLLTFKNQ